MPAVTIASNTPYYYKPRFLGSSNESNVRSDGVDYITQTNGSYSGFYARCKDVHNLQYTYTVEVITTGSDDTLHITKCDQDGTEVEQIGSYGTTGADLEWEFLSDKWQSIDIGVEIRFESWTGPADGDKFWIKLPTLQEMETRRVYTAYSTWVRVPSVENTSFKSGNIPTFLKQKDLMVQLNPTIVDTGDSIDMALAYPFTHYSYAEDMTGTNSGINLFMEWNAKTDGKTDDAAATSTTFTWPSATETWMLGTILLNDRDDGAPFMSPIQIPYDDVTSASTDTGTTQAGNVDIAQKAGYGRFRLDVFSDASGDTARFADNQWWQLIVMVNQ